MKFLLATVLIALLSYLAGLFMPWWSIALVAFLVTLIVRPTIAMGFLAGFVGIFLLWSLIAMWIDIKNEHILSQKIAQLFHLGTSSILLILITALVGGLVGGFAAMSGASLLPLKRRP